MKPLFSSSSQYSIHNYFLHLDKSVHYKEIAAVITVCAYYISDIDAQSSEAVESVDLLSKQCDKVVVDTQQSVELQSITSPSTAPLPPSSVGAPVNSHLELALRQQLRLETFKSQQLVTELRLLQSQLKAETEARVSLQVI